MTITLPAPELPAGRRSALVVATGTYQDRRLAPLSAPASDAAGLAAVLDDPRAGGFDVTQLPDPRVHDLRLTVNTFLAARDSDETVLVYLSCHGILTARRRLYFAAADTDEDQLAATGLDSRWLVECLDECPARRQVVILDCCFSGAFALAKGSHDVGLEEQFSERGRQGRGRVVLTASRATEFSFEEVQDRAGGPRPSVFTGALLDGLRTGAADRDGDGFVTVAEAYRHAHALVTRASGAQTPQHWLYGGEGQDIILARSPAGIAVEPTALPEDLRAGLQSRYPAVRAGTVNHLATWLADPDLSRVATAWAALEEVSASDVPSVAETARARLGESPAGAARQLSQPPGPALGPVPGGNAGPDQRRRLGGRYELEAIVGRGSATEVYRARDLHLGQIVAVEMLTGDRAGDQALLASLRDRAARAVALDHPNIAVVHAVDVDMDGGSPVLYAVMDFVSGRALRELIRDDRDGLRQRAASITAELLGALACLHGRGLVHAAVTPDHVMVTGEGAVKLTGTAIACDDRAATVGYLSPEQAQGEPADARSDLYSAGCLLYELLVGRLPFPGELPVAIAYQHIHERPVPPSRADPAAPGWADEIVLKALAKDPAGRYQSADEMRGDLVRSAEQAQSLPGGGRAAARTRTTATDSGTAQPQVVIFTALEVEYEAIWELVDGPTSELEAHGTLYELGTLPGRGCTWQVAVVQNGPGSMTAAAQLERAARVYAPQVALFLGIAGGRKDVAHGDVVVADAIYDYEGGKSTLEGFQSRARTQEPAHRLVQRAQQVTRQGRWQERIRPCCPDPRPAAFVKPIVTGQKVVTHERSAVGLLLEQVAGDALAVEMEGSGFLRGAYLNKEVDALVIRGISDLLSDKEPASDVRWQPVASRHAAAFAVELLARLGPGAA